MDTPEAPGPPKLNRSEPTRSPPRALARISASPMVSPSGSDQSSGTFSVAHCQSLLGAGPSAVALQRPQESPPLPSSDEPPLHPATSSAEAAARAVHRAKRVMYPSPLAGRPHVPRMAVRPW
ncbi:hypothetical protein SVIOM74S_08276 [Streptomyces violarus]